MHVLHNMFISLCQSRVTAKQKLVVPVLLYTILCICYKILDSPVFVTYQEKKKHSKTYTKLLFVSVMEYYSTINLHLT